MKNRVFLLIGIILVPFLTACNIMSMERTNENLLSKGRCDYELIAQEALG